MTLRHQPTYPLFSSFLNIFVFVFTNRFECSERISSCFCLSVSRQYTHTHSVKHSCSRAGLWWDWCDWLSLPLSHLIILICSGTNRRTPLGVLQAHSQSLVRQKMVCQGYLSHDPFSFLFFPSFDISFRHFSSFLHASMKHFFFQIISWLFIFILWNLLLDFPYDLQYISNFQVVVFSLLPLLSPQSYKITKCKK